MSKNSELFELIKSLNKSEKRYFKLYTSLQKGNKLYLDLFNKIEKQKTYNEKSLLKIFNDNGGKLAFNKNYLRKIIFRSLEAYNMANSVDGNLQRLILRCKILFNKSLYKQYFSAIKKAKQFALKYERFGYFLEILEMEKMYIKKQEIKWASDDSLCDEAQNAIEQISNSYVYSRLIRSLFTIYRSTGTSRIAGHEDLVKSIASNNYMSSISNAKSQRAKMTFYRINEIINKIKADHESVIICAENMLYTINQNPYPFEDFIVNFRSDAIFSIISSSIKSGKLENAEKEIEKLKKIKTVLPSEKTDNELAIVYYQLEIYLKKYDVKKINESIQLLEHLTVKYKDKIESDQELMIHFKLICAFITKEDFPRALSKANYLLNHSLLVTRTDIESFTRILLLIIHYEMRNYALLPYLIRSTYRFLIRNEKLFKLESLVITFLRKLAEVKNEDELNFLFFALHKEMQKLRNDGFEKNAFEYFDFARWIERKTDKKTV